MKRMIVLCKNTNASISRSENVLPTALEDNESVRRHVSKEEYSRYIHQETDNSSAKGFAEILWKEGKPLSDHDDSVTVTRAAGRDKARKTARPSAPVLAAERVHQAECQQETPEIWRSECVTGQHLQRHTALRGGYAGVTVESHQSNRTEQRGGCGIRQPAILTPSALPSKPGWIPLDNASLSRKLSYPTTYSWVGTYSCGRGTPVPQGQSQEQDGQESGDTPASLPQTGSAFRAGMAGLLRLNLVKDTIKIPAARRLWELSLSATVLHATDPETSIQDGINENLLALNIKALNWNKTEKYKKTFHVNQDHA